MRKPVPGAVSNSDFSIRPRPGSPAKAIFYRDVPLWDTVAESLEQYDFFLAERDHAWGDRWSSSARTTAATTMHTENGPTLPPPSPGSQPGTLNWAGA